MSLITKIKLTDFVLDDPTKGNITVLSYEKNDVYGCCICGFAPWPSKGCLLGINVKHLYQPEPGSDFYVIPMHDDHHRDTCVNICSVTPPL